MIKICLICRFKNERHILYEFVHHYLEEGFDTLYLIDNNSDDNYFSENKDWLQTLIEQKKVNISSSNLGQEKSTNLVFNKIKNDYDWVLVCDMDEFMFAVKEKYNIKDLLENKLFNYDYIEVPWKMFKHTNYYQPKSIINDNVLTHDNTKDISSPSHGYKYLIRPKYVDILKAHRVSTKNNPKMYKFKSCHNKFIQNNHYRSQSEEYLRGIKEVRGGGIHPKKYKNYNNHKDFEYKKECNLLKIKRKNLIDKINSKEQLKPKLYINSSFYKENSNINEIQENFTDNKKIILIFLISFIVLFMFLLSFN